MRKRSKAIHSVHAAPSHCLPFVVFISQRKKADVGGGGRWGGSRAAELTPSCAGCSICSICSMPHACSGAVFSPFSFLTLCCCQAKCSGASPTTGGQSRQQQQQTGMQCFYDLAAKPAAVATASRSGKLVKIGMEMESLVLMLSACEQRA